MLAELLRSVLYEMDRRQLKSLDVCNAYPCDDANVNWRHKFTHNSSCTHLSIPVKLNNSNEQKKKGKHVVF